MPPSVPRFSRVKLEQVRFEGTRDATALLLSCTLGKEHLRAISSAALCFKCAEISLNLLISASFAGDLTTLARCE